MSFEDHAQFGGPGARSALVARVAAWCHSRGAEPSDVLRDCLARVVRRFGTVNHKGRGVAEDIMWVILYNSNTLLDVCEGVARAADAKMIGNIAPSPWGAHFFKQHLSAPFEELGALAALYFERTGEHILLEDTRTEQVSRG
jgi:hypothetical protein